MEQLAGEITSITSSLNAFMAEMVLMAGIVAVLLSGLFRWTKFVHAAITAVAVALSLNISVQHVGGHGSVDLFSGMLRDDSLASYMKVLFDGSTLVVIWMSWKNNRLAQRMSEYFVILLGTLLGAHLLVMSVNFIMVFVSLELISLGSYVLVGYAFSREGAEGSFKYFVFGSVASAIMLYGFSMLYGISGSLSFDALSQIGNGTTAIPDGPLLYIASLMGAAGFLYKIAAVPMHPWSPDVYQASPMPVVAYFSVVPKLAGIVVLLRFIAAIPGSADAAFIKWQDLLSIVAILSLTVGNFSALRQRDAKRMMAYSSIAQAGFLLVGVVAFSSQAIQFMLFYATVYTVANLVVFAYLQYYESMDVTSMETFSGVGRSSAVASVFLLIAFIALTGLPPTAGFTAKLFVFSALWEAYLATDNAILLGLLVFGLFNTVVSLFYYIRIPYQAFVRPGVRTLETKNLSAENLFGLIMVLVLLGLFFNPGVLMGWINKINFVL